MEEVGRTADRSSCRRFMQRVMLADLDPIHLIVEGGKVGRVFLVVDRMGRKGETGLEDEAFIRSEAASLEKLGPEAS